MTRILVVDDDDLVRETLVHILIRGGYEAVSAQDGRDALARCHENPPDLILTDIIMPDQDGIEMIIEMRQKNATVPIIAISGGGQAKAMQFLDAARMLGADKILSKPVKQAELLAVVSELLGATVTLKSTAVNENRDLSSKTGPRKRGAGFRQLQHRPRDSGRLRPLLQ